jgi:DNA end-binding protein Ku
MARAIWKGHLSIGEHRVPVKMYAAVQDRKIHFRLLHASDLSPVHQRIVRKTDGKEVPKEDRRKAFPVEGDAAVIIQPGELEALEPETSRDIELCRFVPAGAVSNQWYDRPYYLGPDEDDDTYFALAEAIGRRKLVGVARWVMRRKRYVGALQAVGPYLMMITLRRADQVLSVSAGETTAKPDEKELKLAEQLVAFIEADFDPAQWHDDYRERVQKLIEAKIQGKPLKMAAPKRKQAAGGLADQLRQSIAAAGERKVA